MRNQNEFSLISCRVSVHKERKYTPTGPMYLLSALKQCGIQCDFIDYQLEEDASLFNVPKFVELIDRANADLVGISLFADALPLVLTSINIFQNHFGDKQFILGGPGVNDNESLILQKVSGVVAVVRGEGEHVLPELVKNIYSGKVIDLPGVFSRKNNVQITGKPPLRVDQIDQLRWPDWDALDPVSYNRIQMVSSRGCPFNCSFCEIITMWGRKTTFRDIDDFIDEIEKVRSWADVDEISFIDDTFTLNKKRVYDICEQLIARHIDVKWNCFSRIDTIDEDLMKIMAKAGCSNVFFGIDTGSELLWRNINKKLSRQMVLEVTALAAKYFDITASFIWGYPEESLREFLETIALAYDVSENFKKDTHNIYTQLHFLSPTKATPIYRENHNKLELSDEIPLEICGGKPLKAFSDEEGFDLCYPYIESSRELFAPFYYYRSEGLDKKLGAFKKAESMANSIIGQAFLSDNIQHVLNEGLAELQQEAEDSGIEGAAAKIACLKIKPLLTDPKLIDLASEISEIV